MTPPDYNEQLLAQAAIAGAIAIFVSLALLFGSNQLKKRDDDLSHVIAMFYWLCAPIVFFTGLYELLKVLFTPDLVILKESAHFFKG